MSKNLRLLVLAAALVAFTPLAMAQSSTQEQQSQQQNEGWGSPNTPGSAGCYNAPSATCGN